ncbi:MAG: WcbI family polysaccharide biosynthesis putative acetyltransferase [Acetobacteraceae bacterium]|nr:WcbI family polysaccharide biosynthesis putative acetyltransferase [Acetobacteraceae bacterium]
MRRIVLIGDFQVHAMAGLFQRFVAIRTGDRLTYIPFHQRTEQPAQAAIRQADLLVEQVDTAPLPATDAACPRVPIPRVSAAFLWPFAGQPHPRNAPHPFLPPGPYGGEAGDRYLNALIADGVTPEDALDRTLSLDVARQVDLDGLLEATLTRQRARDAASGYRIADAIAHHFRREPIFRSPNHPNARIARLLAAQLFHRLGAQPAEIARMAQATTRSPFPREELPVHPAVARHFGLRWAGPARRYRLLNEGDFTFRDFVLRYMRYEWNAALEEGLVLSRSADLAAAEGRLTEGLARSPGSAEGHNALRSVLVRQGRLAEALAAGARAVAADPGFAAYRVELANVLRRAGRMEEAEGEYRAAVALDPANATAMALLAQVLVQQGRHEEAAAAVTDALEVEPYAPALRGMLGVRT